MKGSKIILFLILIIFLGGFLRFYSIGKQSFWLDESATALAIKKYSLSDTFYNTIKLGQILPDYYNSNLDLPPYYFILKIWSNIFGINEASLRSFSAIFGVFSIIAVYFLSKELFDKRTGLVASLIFSLNVVMIEYSQEARLYNMLIFIVLLSAYFLIKSLKTSENKYIGAFIIFNIIGIYTHYPFLFFVIFELFFVFFALMKEYTKKRRLKVKKAHVAALSLVVFYIPLVYRILKPKLVASHHLGSFSISNILKLFLQLNTWIYPSESLRDKINSLQFNLFSFSEWFLVVSVVLLAILLFVFVFRNFIKIKNIDDNRLFLMFWLVIPSIVAFSALYKSIMTFGSLKHFIFVVPPYLILAANGLSKLKGKKFMAFVFITAILSIAPIYSYYSNPSKPQYREAVRFLESNADNELIIVNLPSVVVPFNYYSDKLVNVNGANNLEEAERLSSDKNFLWLVLSTKYADSDGKIKPYFDKNYKIHESKFFYGVSLYHYTK